MISVSALLSIVNVELTIRLHVLSGFTLGKHQGRLLSNSMRLASGAQQAILKSLAGVLMPLCLDVVARLENPTYRQQTRYQKSRNHAGTEHNVDVGNALETPAESADQVHHWIE